MSTPVYRTQKFHPRPGNYGMGSGQSVLAIESAKQRIREMPFCLGHQLARMEARFAILGLLQGFRTWNWPSPVVNFSTRRPNR
jgi:hypothetical protein